MTGSAWIFIVLKIVMPRRAFALPVMAGHPAPGHRAEGPRSLALPGHRTP